MPFQRFDLSIVKRVRFTESKNLEVRGEFLNAFNNINFNVGTNGICAGSSGSSATCGQFAASYRDPNQQNDPGGRLVQLVLRVNF